MKRYLAILISLPLFQLACQDTSVKKDERRVASSSAAGDSQTQTQNQAGSSPGKILRVSWDASTGTTTEYHIYGLAEEKNSGGKEFASLTVTDANKSAPAVDIDLAKTSLPKAGKVCFYVIAENNGVNSPASNSACMTP